MGELGSWLTQTREARGLTLEDAERDTRISRRYLHALETEQFDIIPAPVYARGFLRSYSQYLGLDPKEVLALFPREDDYPNRANQQGPSKDNPIPAQSLSRPRWREAGEEPARPPRREPPRFEDAPRAPARAERRPMPPPAARRERDEYEDDYYDDPPVVGGAPEPMIGVDIGVPTPARRIQTDPAAQTRSLLVAIVAIAAIVGVLVLAFLISGAGSDDSGGDGLPGGSANAAGADDPTETEEPDPTVTAIPGGPAVTVGEVPSVVGYDITVAEATVRQAGFEVTIIDFTGGVKGEVMEQAPPPGTPRSSEGQSVMLAVGTGS